MNTDITSNMELPLAPTVWRRSPVAASRDCRAIFFFDIDNCLYPRSRDVHAHMARLINQYFVKHLTEMSPEEATRLHLQYYKDYGLAIEGLSRHHKVDPLDFNREVDDAVPLDGLLFTDPDLRRLLLRFDPMKVKLWLFTNAHVTHGRRVVRLLGVEDLFEGITFCDYRVSPLVPKPLPEMFEKALREAGWYDGSVGSERTDREQPRKSGRDVFFVDDSYLNCARAYERGWLNTVHLVEEGVEEPEKKACQFQVRTLDELLALFPDLLRPEAESIEHRDVEKEAEKVRHEYIDTNGSAE